MSPRTSSFWTATAPSAAIPTNRRESELCSRPLPDFPSPPTSSANPLEAMKNLWSRQPCSPEHESVLSPRNVRATSPNPSANWQKAIPLLRETNRAEHPACKFVNAIHKDLVARYRKHLAALDARIAELIRTDTELSKADAKLREVSGVGNQTSRAPFGLPARTRPCRQACDRRAGRTHALRQRQRKVQRQTLHSRRPEPDPPGALYGRTDRRAVQSARDGLLSKSAQSRQNHPRLRS